MGSYVPNLYGAFGYGNAVGYIDQWRYASAAEIVSGSLQDMDRAVLVGQRSFGKGLVQAPRDLPYNGKVKITMSKYYIPSGRCIQQIDYSHRKEDGSVAAIPDSLTSVFYTSKKRPVRDGVAYVRSLR